MEFSSFAALYHFCQRSMAESDCARNADRILANLESLGIETPRDQLTYGGLAAASSLALVQEASWLCLDHLRRDEFPRGWLAPVSRTVGPVYPPRPIASPADFAIYLRGEMANLVRAEETSVSWLEDGRRLLKNAAHTFRHFKLTPIPQWDIEAATLAECTSRLDRVLNRLEHPNKPTAGSPSVLSISLSSPPTDANTADERDTVDTKRDTQKKKKKLPMMAEATECARRYRKAKSEGDPAPMKQVVEDYVHEKNANGESCRSVSYIRRVLSDNPNQWK